MADPTREFAAWLEGVTDAIGPDALPDKRQWQEIVQRLGLLQGRGLTVSGKPPGSLGDVLEALPAPTPRMTPPRDPQPHPTAVYTYNGGGGRIA